MTDQLPPNVILERMRELREDMADQRRMMREVLARMSSLESRLGGIENSITLLHADHNRFNRRFDDHEDRIYDLERNRPEDHPLS